MAKPKRPLKPFRGAKWNEERKRWDGTPPKPKLKGYSPNNYVGSIKWKPMYSLQKSHTTGHGLTITMAARPKNKKKPLTNQQKRERIYDKLKPVWRAQPANQHCAAHCKAHNIFTPAENYPHHKKGRVGDLLNDVRYWMPVCDKCHSWIHAHPAASYQLGWLIKSGSTTN